MNNSSTNTNDQVAVFDELLAAMPEPQEHAINMHIEAENAIAEKTSEIKSTHPEFDPAVHKTDDNGNPVLTASGQLAKKRGRKNGTTAQSKSVVGAPQSAPEIPPANINARATGKVAANLLMTLGVVIGGEEWQPVCNKALGVDEKTMLEGAFADYFEATGRTDLPPALTLTVAIGGYMLPRFTMPKTQSRLGKLKDWVIKKWADRKLKKYGLKAESVDKKRGD